MPTTPEDLLGALAMRASWIAAPGATGPGSWLLRRDVDLGQLLDSADGSADARIVTAHLVVAGTGDVEAALDGITVLDVRRTGPSSAAVGIADVTDHLLVGDTQTDHVAIALRQVEDRPVRRGGGSDDTGSVLAALVLSVRRGEWTTDVGERIVVGTDTSWWTTPGPIGFASREDPTRRMLEEHEAVDAWADVDAADHLAWTRFGAMHTDPHRQWRPAVDQGRHPSLAHPRLVSPPPLVREDDITVHETVMAPGGVQCLDLGQTVRSRPVLALPEGARRPVTVWAGPVPGTPPRGGDIRIRTHGRPVVLEPHGTTSGRWLHIHGAPDLEVDEAAVPVRTGILPRPLALEVADEDIALLLSDGMATLLARSQERYLGRDDVPLLGDIARTARTALFVGADTWRSAQALEEFLATARDEGEGMVVRAIAPDGPDADLDEHTFALPGWVADHTAWTRAPRSAGHTIGGISARLLHRIENGPSPSGRMTCAYAALDALTAYARLARRSSGDPAPYDRAHARLVEETRARLRSSRTTGGRGGWRDTAQDTTSTIEATALAALAGITPAEDRPFTLTVLRRALDDIVELDPTGLARAALVRLGAGREVVAAHRAGDDLPPLVLAHTLRAMAGLVADGDRVRIGVPSLEVEAIDLSLPHPRGAVHVRWEEGHGSIEVPEGVHVLVDAPGGGAPVWYNSGSAELRRPAPRP